MLSAVLICSVCHAAVYFKMEAPKTSLLPNEIVTVTISAWADDARATGANGLNGWGLSALIDQTGVTEVVSGSVVFLSPSPWSINDTFAGSINQAATGGTGSIQDLQLLTNSLPQSSSTGIGGYSAIAQFDIRAIGNVNDAVSYTLGGQTFSGMLADFTEIAGQFDANQSARTFTIVPEPASLMILASLSATGLLRRRR
jgi:hypothetical protein